jgi:hypothetical protein
VAAAVFAEHLQSLLAGQGTTLMMTVVAVRKLKILAVAHNPSLADKDNRAFDNPIDPGDCTEVDSLKPDARAGWQARVYSHASNLEGAARGHKQKDRPKAVFL